MRVLESIFARLANPEIVGLARVKAVIQLFMLIRFPKGDLEYEAAVMQASAIYLTQKGRSSSKINESPEIVEFLFCSMNINRFREVAAFSHQSSIMFDLIDFGGMTVEESDVIYIYEIVKFILWYEPTKNKHDRRKHVSLNKAYAYIFYLSIKENIIVSWSKNTFQSSWDKWAPISCLIYAMRECLEEGFVLNPEQNEFAVIVDQLANDCQLTDRIVGVASCAYARLRARLRKLLKAVDWPEVSRWENLAELPSKTLPKESVEMAEADNFEVPLLTLPLPVKYDIKPLKKKR